VILPKEVQIQEMKKMWKTCSTIINRNEIIDLDVGVSTAATGIPGSRTGINTYYWFLLN
jgi:hypothetical protein